MGPVVVAMKFGYEKLRLLASSWNLVVVTFMSPPRSANAISLPLPSAHISSLTPLDRLEVFLLSTLLTLVLSVDRLT